MYYEPQLLDNYLIRNLKRLSEADAIEAIHILSQRLLDLRNPDYYLSIRVEELPLSTKASNALLNNQLLTVQEVINFGYEKLGLLRGLGPSTLDEIRLLIERITEQKEFIRGLSGFELRAVLLLKKFALSESENVKRKYRDEN